MTPVQRAVDNVHSVMSSLKDRLPQHIHVDATNRILGSVNVLSNLVNHYDEHDTVRQEYVMHGGKFKIAAYRVRDFETREWSSIQFHMTCGDIVVAVMPESFAKLFTTCVTTVLEGQDLSREDLEVSALHHITSAKNLLERAVVHENQVKDLEDVHAAVLVNVRERKS